MTVLLLRKQAVRVCVCVLLMCRQRYVRVQLRVQQEVHVIGQRLSR